MSAQLETIKTVVEGNYKVTDHGSREAADQWRTGQYFNPTRVHVKINLTTDRIVVDLMGPRTRGGTGVGRARHVFNGHAEARDLEVVYDAITRLYDETVDAWY